jgi:hypothetical protein
MSSLPASTLSETRRTASIDRSDELHRRRMRLVREALPPRAASVVPPATIPTDAVLAWLWQRLEPAELYEYFHELAAIARRDGDHELLHLAKQRLDEN